jgi:hypothetical protein
VYLLLILAAFSLNEATLSTCLASIELLVELIDLLLGEDSRVDFDDDWVGLMLREELLLTSLVGLYGSPELKGDRYEASLDELEEEYLSVD